MKVTKIPLTPSYKDNTGVWVIDINTIPFPQGFTPQEQYIISFPPQQIGGNHKHPRQEAFIGLGPDFYLIWQDTTGTLHEELMSTDNQLFLFFVPSMVPHAVINKSLTTNATLYEFADAKQHDKESVILV